MRTDYKAINSRVAASIVAYKTNTDELSGCIQALRNAGIDKITVVDNSPDDTIRNFCPKFVRYIFTGKNLGYGSAHNIAIRSSLADSSIAYHLVVNTDISFSPDIISRISAFMDTHPKVGLLSPRTVGPEGSIQPSVRLLPTPFDLIIRRFLPNQWFKSRRRRYILSDRDYECELNAAYHQGSFMFFRTEALRREGPFDERFFMYPEDIDLSRRIHRNWTTLYWPQATIVHNHRRQSYHSMRMLYVHIVNMIRYFNKYGWIFDAERRRLNNRILNESYPRRQD